MFKNFKVWLAARREFFKNQKIRTGYGWVMSAVFFDKCTIAEIEADLSRYHANPPFVAGALRALSDLKEGLKLP